LKFVNETRAIKLVFIKLILAIGYKFDIVITYKNKNNMIMVIASGKANDISNRMKIY